MTSHASIVAILQDRFAWWASPPAVARPTPALAGWTIEEWLSRGGVVIPSTDERFSKQFPGAVDLHGHDPVALARLALQRLCLRDIVEIAPGAAGVWRARVRLRRPA